MKQTEVLVKWTGSKRVQGPLILPHFPDHIDTYYEPFLGGASMLFVLLSSDKQVKKFVGSDICEPLIGIYELVKTNPESLLDAYAEHWKALAAEGKTYYYNTRKIFNQDKDPKKFLFLSRTCRNGLARFNRKNEFNSGFHLKRPGIHPDKLKRILSKWHQLFCEHDVEFRVADYKTIQSNPGDFVYLDPPYATPTERYFYSGMIDYDVLWTWCRMQRGAYAISLNGFKDEIDWRLDVPADIFNEHFLVENGYSKFDQLLHNQVLSKDGLYIREAKP